MELINTQNFQAKKSKAKSDENSKDEKVQEGDKEERVITIRPLNMEDFKEAKNQVITPFTQVFLIQSKE